MDWKASAVSVTRALDDKTLLEQILCLPLDQQDRGIRDLARRLVDEGDADPNELASIELILRNLVEAARRRATMN